MFGRWQRRAVEQTLAAALVLAVTPARGEEPPGKRGINAALSTAPDACFDGPALAASIGTWLKTQEVDTRISILVRRPSEGLLRFTVERSAKLVGERDLPVGALPCPDLRAALSLAIAIAIDSTLLESLGIEPPASAPTERDSSFQPPPAPSLPTVAPPAEPDRLRPTRAPAPRDSGSSASLGIEAVTLFGVLPGPALGAAPRLGFAPTRHLELRAAALGTTRAQTSLGGGTASASLVAGELSGCFLSNGDELRAGGCVGVAGGGVSAQGVGHEPSYSPNVRWAAATARAEARYPGRSRVAALIGVTLVVPVVRPELEVVDRQGATVDTWRTPIAGFGVGLGADLAIW